MESLILKLKTLKVLNLSHFKKIPSELTYWHDGVLTTVHVDDFVELAPNLIQYRDSESGKRVKVKAEYPIKYILKEK